MRPELPYTCPQHSGVHRSRPGYCPQCGTSRVPQATAFAIVSNPVQLALSALALIALLALITLLRH